MFANIGYLDPKFTGTKPANLASSLQRSPELQTKVGFSIDYPLASGFLTGKYLRNSPKPDSARITKDARYQEMYMTDANWTRLENLQAFCTQRGRTLLELAFSWLAAQPVVACVIAGATKAEQLEANVKAADWALTPEELKEIDRISGPAWLSAQ